jgi:nitroreductase
MKKMFLAVFTATLFLGCFRTVVAQENRGPAASILNHYAARNFIEGSIPAADLELILQAGIRAPSARNLQPWHFTVVQSQALAKKMVSDTMNGNVLIVVSAKGDGKTNGVQILDCALAVESIYLAAQALGYGSRIYTGPMDSLNKNLKSELGLPSGYSAVALIRLGKVQSGIDAVSAASSRKKAEDLVTYK